MLADTIPAVRAMTIDQMISRSLLSLISVCSWHLSVPWARAQDELTPKERQAIVEKLEALDGAASQRRTTRFNAAVTAFRQAITSNDQVMDLYLQCIEKVRYEEQNRPLIEFREWKRQNKDRLGEAALREALRHQVRWLLLGLEMSGKQLAPADMADKAGAAIADIARDARSLAPHMGILRESAFQSVFAQAYKIGQFAPEKWPQSPIPVGPVYQQVIFPPLRDHKEVKRLEAAWTARLEHETLQITMQSEKDEDKGEARMEKFTTDERPQLVWAMLTDLYMAGGQRAAAMRMLTFLEANLSHRLATEWTAEMKTMLVPEDLTPAAAPVADGGNTADSVAKPAIGIQAPVPAAEPPPAPVAPPPPASRPALVQPPAEAGGLDPFEELDKQ